MIECSWGASRTKDSFYNQFFCRLYAERKKNRMKIQVAVARKMLVAAWYILKDGVPYKAPESKTEQEDTDHSPTIQL